MKRDGARPGAVSHCRSVTAGDALLCRPAGSRLRGRADTEVWRACIAGIGGVHMVESAQHRHPPWWGRAVVQGSELCGMRVCVVDDGCVSAGSWVALVWLCCPLTLLLHQHTLQIGHDEVATNECHKSDGCT